MKNKFLGSLALAGMTLGSMQAMDFNFFGHVGAGYDQGFGNGNRWDGVSDKVGYAGFTGHLGMDFGFNALHLGLGAYSGVPIWGTKNQATHLYSTRYIDLSDLYLKYDTEELKIAVGRFNNDFLESDWLTSYQQGVAAKWNVKSFGMWATWMNDFTTYGYQPGRIASELFGWSPYSSTYHGFGIGNEILALGMNFDFDFLKIDPFVHYYTYGSGTIQAGTKLALVFGEDGPVQSTTALRFMWQNEFGANGDSTMLFWGDQELLFGGFFKLGAGYYGTTGGAGIYSVNNVTRFYGRYLTPIDYTSSYFGANASTWYLFTGVTSQWFDLDVLYSEGSHDEFSAIASVTVFDTEAKGSLNGFALKVGGGYVSNGFNRAWQQHNVVAFVKLSY